MLVTKTHYTYCDSFKDKFSFSVVLPFLSSRLPKRRSLKTSLQTSRHFSKSLAISKTDALFLEVKMFDSDFAISVCAIESVSNLKTSRRTACTLKTNKSFYTPSQEKQLVTLVSGLNIVWKMTMSWLILAVLK